MTKSDGSMVEAGWLLVAILTPLSVNLWGSRPFDPAKLALLRVLVVLMAAGWLSGWLWRGRRWQALRGELAPRSLLAPVVAVAVVGVASTVVATNPTLSLWGSTERAAGLATLLAYVLLAVVTGANLRGNEQARRLLGVMALTAIPLLLLGALQAVGRDPLGLVSDARSPVYGTLGRSNFVGAYVALLMPLTLGMALATSLRAARIGLWILAAAQVALIALTAARAAWVSAAAGLLLLAGGLLWLQRAAWRRWIAVAAGVLLFGGGLAAAWLLWQADGGSLAARRVIWLGVLRLIGERPLLGFGPDSLGVHFVRVFEPELVFYQGRQVFVDRAHNWLLDRAATQGVLGLLALCWLWAATLWSGWRAARRAGRAGREERALLLLCCVAALGGNLAGNLFSFDTAATAAAGWLLLGVIMGLGRGEAAMKAERLAAPGGKGPRVALAALLLGSTLWVSWQSSGRYLLADAAHQRSLRLAAQGNMVEGTIAAEEAVSCWPWEAAYWQQLAEVRGAQGELEAAEDAWRQALALRGNDARLRSARGQFYADVALRLPSRLPSEDRTVDAEALSRAHGAFAQAVALAPNVARLHVAWARVYMQQGQWTPAVEALEQAVDLDTTDWLAWGLLAEAYTVVERPAAAQWAREQAEKWLPAD